MHQQELPSEQTQQQMKLLPAPVKTSEFSPLVANLTPEAQAILNNLGNTAIAKSVEKHAAHAARTFMN